MRKQLNPLNYFSKRILKRFNLRKSHRVLASALLTVFIITGITIFTAASASENFPAGTLFTVEKGMTLDQIAGSLKAQGYIRSSTLFKAIVRGVYQGENNAVAGDYLFDQHMSAFTLAKRIVKGQFNLGSVRVTIPEGLNKFEIADILVKSLNKFEKDKFLALATEGYLFPDTYFIAPNASPEVVIDMMKNNFDRQIEPHLGEIKNFGRPFGDVIKMASIIETEARQYDTRRTIADILWRRLDDGTPLQVDVSFKYVNGETTHDLSLEDLNIDSLYNSYRYPGLPPTPISNPGLDSILAAISPLETKYYFFLSDPTGKMHYATTFEEHKKNRILYLR